MNCFYLHQFEGNETPAATVFNVLNGRPKDGECLSLYGSRLVTSLVSKWKEMSIEQVAVNVVLAHAAQIEPKLQRTIFTTDIKTRNEMQKELKAFAFGKKKDHSVQDNSASKKARLQPIVKCHFCGKQGHKIADCRARGKTQQESKQHAARSSEVKSGTIICFKCGKAGHIKSACPGGSSSSFQNKVDEKTDRSYDSYMK